MKKFLLFIAIAFYSATALCASSHSPSKDSDKIHYFTVGLSKKPVSEYYWTKIHGHRIEASKVDGKFYCYKITPDSSKTVIEPKERCLALFAGLESEFKKQEAAVGIMGRLRRSLKGDKFPTKSSLQV